MPGYPPISEDLLRCISPVDGSVYAERRTCSESDAVQALERARSAQIHWKLTSIADRATLCKAAVAALMAMANDIVPELAWQMGRPISQGGGELVGFDERAQHMIAIAEEALGEIEIESSDTFRRSIRREPLGTVLVIVPWNYPYLTVVSSLVPALMAGNAVILKHSAQTPLVGERLQVAFDEAGLPPGLFQNLFLTHDQTERILRSGQVQHVNFTGSVSGGRHIEVASAGAFIGTGMELGGKDPAYVREDCDLQLTIENLADGAFFNAGQSCCGIERIYAHSSLFHDLVAGVVNLAAQYQLGNPLELETTLGPMVSTASADRVRRQIDEAIGAGARAHVDANSFDATGRGPAYLPPQVLTEVDHSMSIMTEETFGPVVGIMEVEDDDQAIRLMNDSIYGLTASVWSSDQKVVEDIGSQIETGTVFMNRCDYLDPALAWTGIKNSGRGATLSRVGYESLTRPKSFHFRK